ncbi:MAG: HAD family hydrolase, partial [bacterium]
MKKSMTFEAVLFDLDGTLLNTLEDIADAANTVLVRHGYPTHALDDYRYFVGDGAPVLVRRVIPEAARSDDVVERLYEEFRVEYGRNWNAKTRPYAGVPAMLDGLSRLSLKLAVLSNKPDDFTRRCVSELLPEGRFDVVSGVRNGTPPKPDPTGALRIAAELEIAPERCLFAGDTSIDVKTAIAA